MNLAEIEAALRARLEAFPPAARAELLHVLRLANFDRADRIGEFWGHPETRELRGAAHRLGGGPDLAGGPGRDVAGG
jgi:hypothetical protein